MKQFSSLLLVGISLVLFAPMLAANTNFAQNNFDDTVMTVVAQGPDAPSGYDGYLADMQSQGLDSGPFCFLSPDSIMDADNESVGQGIAEGALKIGNNSIYIYECTTADCEQKTLVGTYNFTLSQTSDNTYAADPTEYQFDYTINGVPCHWDSSRLETAIKFLHIH